MHSVFIRDPVHLLRERERIDAVKKLEERQRMPDFVFLQMANKVPAQARREQRDLGARLLHAAFAKQSLTSFIYRPHFLRVVRFGNRHELDIVRRAAFFFSCIGNLRSHMLQVLPNFLHAERFHCWNRAARILLSEARTPAFLKWIRAQLHHYLLVNRSVIGQNMLLMKRCLFFSDLSLQTSVPACPLRPFSASSRRTPVKLSSCICKPVTRSGVKSNKLTRMSSIFLI